MDANRPMIIAMQGDPCTGKTSLANYLAKEFKCSSIRLDDILNVICPLIKPANHQTLISQAFDVIIQMVITQIYLGLSIIVDSPLARRSHLEKLCGLLEKKVAHKLIIIECKPKTNYTWQLRFNNHSSNRSYKNKWYKPQSWPFDPEFSRDYTDDEVNHPLVSKLVINTTDPIQIGRVIRTLHVLVSSDKGHKIEFDKLCVALSKADHSSAQNVDDDISTDKGFCTRTHRVKIYREKGIGRDAACGVCQNPMTKSEAVYTCELCPLAIHKSCADSKKEFTPKNFPKFLRLEPKESFCYPEEHLCLHCEKEGKEFSYECGSCVFECHLKCQLIPTIVQHPAHEHLLYILVKPISKGLSYQCMACRDDGDNAAYHCVKGCRGLFHPKCLLLPPVVREHAHCGYTHDLDMIIQRDKEMEDYICHLCFELMNPDAWYYCCKICHLDMHLNCAFEEFK